jgi:hypothetical protein
MDRRKFFSALSAGSLVALPGMRAEPHATPGSKEVEGTSTVDELRRTDPAESQWMFVQGYHKPLDGGGGLFVWKDGGVDEPDGGLVIQSLLNTYQPGQEKSGRWYRVVNAPVWNIRWWGARGTGEVNDAPAFQAALDAARTQTKSSAGRGGKIVVPSGKYRLDEMVRVPLGVSITGAGMAATRLVPGFDKGIMLQIEPNAGYQVIQKLSFWEGSSNLTALKLAGHGEEGERSGNRSIHISDVYVWGYGRGVYGERTWMSRLSNVRVKKAETGIEFEDGYTTLLLENCFVDNCTVGIRMRGIDTATFNSCAVDKARQHAVWLEKGSYVFNTFQSEANWYTENVSSIFRVDGPCTVQFNGCVTHGIGIEDADENSDAENDRLYLFDCRANNGPVHVDATTGRQEETNMEPGKVGQIRFVSESVEYTVQSSVSITQGLFEGVDQINVNTPNGSTPRLSTPQISRRAGIGNEEEDAYQIRGRIAEDSQVLDTKDASLDEIAQVLAALINDLQQSGIID